MTDHIEGVITDTFVTKSGDSVVFRYPRRDDVVAVTDYINTLSAEDTFITFSGEVVSVEEEEKYLKSVVESMEKGDSVYIYAEHEGKIVGVTNVERDKVGKKRKHHVATFGISVAKEYRGQGVGKKLMEVVIAEAKKNIKGLKMIKLTAFGVNAQALELYQKLGFREFGSLPQGLLYRGEYIDEKYMHLPL